MTQKFYLHDVTSSDTGTLPGATNLAGSAVSHTDASAATNRNMDGSIGSLQVSIAIAILVTDINSAWYRRFISPPLAAGVISSGTWTLQCGGKQSASGADSYVVSIFQWRPSTGTLIATIINQTLGTSSMSGVAEAALSGTTSGTAFTLVDGDILVCEVFLIPQQIASSTDTFYYDGTTEASATTNAAFIQAPVNLPLFGGSTPAQPPIRRRILPWELLPI